MISTWSIFERGKDINYFNDKYTLANFTLGFLIAGFIGFTTVTDRIAKSLEDTKSAGSRILKSSFDPRRHLLPREPVHKCWLSADSLFTRIRCFELCKFMWFRFAFRPPTTPVNLSHWKSNTLYLKFYQFPFPTFPKILFNFSIIFNLLATWNQVHILALYIHHLKNKCFYLSKGSYSLFRIKMV